MQNSLMPAPMSDSNYIHRASGPSQGKLWTSHFTSTGHFLTSKTKDNDQDVFEMFTKFQKSQTAPVSWLRSHLVHHVSTRLQMFYRSVFSHLQLCTFSAVIVHFFSPVPNPLIPHCPPTSAECAATERLLSSQIYSWTSGGTRSDSALAFLPAPDCISADGAGGRPRVSAAL